MRVLTKSRFKLGLECPNKLFYTRKAEYANSKEEDTFLLALAEGGFQVEELARLHYPNGILIEGEDGNYLKLWETTKQLLEQENVVIYEAAFLYEDLFIRTDVLVKQGNKVLLIEVKSKSIDPTDPYRIVGSRGGIKSDWKPYLNDIAFQQYVMQKCYPDWGIKAHMLLGDKTKKTSIDGLNQLFRITKQGTGRTGIKVLVNSKEETGSSILVLEDVSKIVEDIGESTFEKPLQYEFAPMVNYLKELYVNNEYANYSTTHEACKSCEFVATLEEGKEGLKSGFVECFQKQHSWSNNQFNKPNILDLKGVNYRKLRRLFSEGKHFMDQLTQEDIGYNPLPDRYSVTERAWIQINKETTGDMSIQYDQKGLKKEMAQWGYPLHFIDFETATSALPFTKGRRPYEQVAFQFSHHIYHENGFIEHASEYIYTDAGAFPNYHFLGQLKCALEDKEGTIFMFADHENKILNAIYRQLQETDLPDKEDLIAFLKSISHSSRESPETWRGDRDMVDLRDVIKNYYYNPYTLGSNSLKNVLPAILRTSGFLQQKYSQPIGVLDISSKNFDSEHIWLHRTSDGISSPYKTLPSLFEGWTDEKIEQLQSELGEIADGGAAMVAYAKLQYTDMSAEESQVINRALLKYCELDTLAMVMLYEHLKELV